MSVLLIVARENQLNGDQFHQDQDSVTITFLACDKFRVHVTFFPFCLTTLNLTVLN